MVSHVNFFNGMTIFLKKCVLLDLSFDSSSTVWIPDAASPPHASHAAGDQRIPSMVIQLLFLCLYPLIKVGNTGDLRVVISSTRRMDLTAVPSPASKSWNYLESFLSQIHRPSTRRIMFAKNHGYM